MQNANNAAPAAEAPMMHPRGRGGMMAWIILGVLVIALAVAGFLFRDRLFPKDAKTATEKSSGYQAVFLSNGQVYFGKLSNSGGSYATLTDIYYLQVTQPPLQGSQQQGQQSSTQQPQISLVKLGNELHGPVDSMKINRDQILFYEDMKDSAKVMAAIKDYKANGGSTATPQTQAPATQTPATNTTK